MASVSVTKSPQCVAFKLQGRPVAWARARLSGRRFFKSTDQRAFQDYVAGVAAKAASGLFFAGPVSLTATFYFERPKSHLKLKERPKFMASRPDLDNNLKNIADSLNTVLWKDDAQVVRLCGEKRYSDEAGAYTWVEITEL
jgi:Holliday junction resolvase RusA-like endonuclease